MFILIGFLDGFMRGIKKPVGMPAGLSTFPTGAAAARSTSTPQTGLGFFRPTGRLLLRR
jgi:hypothetical protein